MYQRIWSLATVLILLATPSLLLPTVAANAAPGDPPAADSPTLSLTDLGSASDLLFYGEVGTASLTIPVPVGMSPATLNVTAQLPVNVLAGTVTVSQDNKVIAQVGLPPDRGPVSIPLAGAEVRDNAVSILLRSYLLPLEGYCLDPTNPLRLTDITVTYAGVEQIPATVADFLPPVLRKLVVFIGRNPSQAEADAAVQVASAVVARYGSQYPDIEVAPLADPPFPPGDTPPFERHIVVSEGPDAGVSLYGDTGVPALLISGPAAELTNQTRLLTSNLASYALTSKAVVGPLKATPQLPGNETTIRKMGQPGVNATSLNPRVDVGLNQTRLGRSAHGIRVHLQGSYTPLPNDIGGQVVVSVAGQNIDRWPADQSGTIDRWIDVPDRLLKRYTNLEVQVNISGGTGRCGEFQPITLTIDGETLVQSSPAAPPVPGGFQSVPQSLMPRVQIGIGSDVFGDTARAVEIMTGLQRLSALPMDTVVMPIQQAIDSPNPAVLISPQSWDHPDIRLPVWAPDAVPTVVNAFDDQGDPTTLTLAPELRFGSLQTVFQNNRTLLVATSNGAPGQLDDLLKWLGADQRRWPAIDGLALVSVADRSPVTVTIPEAATAEPVVNDRSTARWWWIGGALLAAVVAASVVIHLRSRRKPTSG